MSERKPDIVGDLQREIYMALGWVGKEHKAADHLNAALELIPKLDELLSQQSK